MTWGAEQWSALANVAMAGAAIGGAVAAFRGLNAWKNQSIWAADNELARKILIALYRYRDSLYAVRHPAMYEAEMKVEDEDRASLSDSEIRQRGTILAYARRWERHLPFVNELDALLVEADAVWGKELSEKVLHVKELERELFSYIRLHLDAHFRGPTEIAKEYRKILATKRDILYDSMSEEDVFRKEFSERQAPVDIYLRSKLGRET